MLKKQFDIEQELFGGFYNTIWDNMVDNYIDDLYYVQVDEIGEKQAEKLEQDYLEALDYKAFMQDVAKAFVIELAKKLDIKLDFVKLVSPVSYNYWTDYIVVEGDELAYKKALLGVDDLHELELSIYYKLEEMNLVEDNIDFKKFEELQQGK